MVVQKGLIMAKQSKLDLYATHRSEYVTPKIPALVMVGPAKYLSIVGTGAPAGDQFQAAIGALYGVAFTLKMTEKFAGHDYKVCHLEGLWWTGSGGEFKPQVPEDCHWRLLIRVPEFITQPQVDAAIHSVMAKGKASLAKDVKLEELTEGRCVQMLHVGPYADEKPDLESMRKFAEAQGVHLRGPHHEIYLSDPRRVPKQRLRTILRYPVQ